MSNENRRSDRRLSAADLETLNRQIVVAARAGTPLVPALRSLSRDLSSGRLRDAVGDLARDLEAGASLSEAFARRPGRFPPLYAAMLRAAETSGNLRGVMDVLSHLVTSAAALRRKIAVAAVYPIIVLLLTLGVLAFLMARVVPVLTTMTTSFSDAFREFGEGGRGSVDLIVMETLAGVVAVVVVAALVTFAVSAFAPGSGGGWARRVPLIGPVLRAQGHFVFCRTFAALLRGGVPMREALAVVREVVPDAASRRGVDRVAAALASGRTLGDAMHDAALAGEFPESLAWLTETAESRGDLPGGLDEAGRYFCDEADRRSAFLMEIVPPAMIIVVGGMIVMLVFPMLLSLVNLMTKLGQVGGM
jgi:general secretion pathway protein F